MPTLEGLAQLTRLSLHRLIKAILALQDGLFMIAFDKPWAAVEWAVTLQMAMLRCALLISAGSAY